MWESYCEQICNNDEDDAYLFVCCFVFLVRYYVTTTKVQQLVLCAHKERLTSGPVCVTLACSPCSYFVRMERRHVGVTVRV